MFRLNPPAPAPAHSIILAIDDATFNSMGGVGGYRAMWAKAFDVVKRANPKAVALDVVLADPWKRSGRRSTTRPRDGGRPKPGSGGAFG